MQIAIVYSPTAGFGALRGGAVVAAVAVGAAAATADGPLGPAWLRDQQQGHSPISVSISVSLLTVQLRCRAQSIAAAGLAAGQFVSLNGDEEQRVGDVTCSPWLGPVLGPILRP